MKFNQAFFSRAFFDFFQLFFDIPLVSNNTSKKISSSKKHSLYIYIRDLNLACNKEIWVGGFVFSSALSRFFRNSRLICRKCRKSQDKALEKINLAWSYDHACISFQLSWPYNYKWTYYCKWICNNKLSTRFLFPLFSEVIMVLLLLFLGCFPSRQVLIPPGENDECGNYQLGSDPNNFLCHFRRGLKIRFMPHDKLRNQKFSYFR